jgi:hypothetical protein
MMLLLMWMPVHGRLEHRLEMSQQLRSETARAHYRWDTTQVRYQQESLGHRIRRIAKQV